MRTYRKIAEIHIRHNFYKKGIVAANDFGFFKTPETEELLSNYRLMLKFKTGRIEVIQECEQEDGVIAPFIEIEHELKLSIVMQLKNKQFFSFSELPFIQMGKELFFFTNRRAGKITQSGQLNHTTFSGSDDICLLLPKSSGQIAELSWDTQKTLISPDEKTKQTLEQANDFAEQALRLTDGYYEIKSKNKAEVKFVLLKTKYSASDVGLIEFFVNKEMARSIQNEPQEFSIDFDSRKLQWQYQVFERFNSIKNIKIVDEKSEIEFSEQAQVELNGMQSKLFISKQQIPLQEVTKQTFKIVSPNNGRAGKTWVEKLPIPKLSNINKMDNQSDNLVFKEYVYL